MMRLMSLSIKFFARSQVSSTKKNGWKKQIWWGIHGRNTRNYGQGCPRNAKKPQSSRWGYLTVRNRKFSIISCKISNMTVEILRISEGYVTTTIFTLMLQNGLLVLVAPHFQNQYKKCQKKSWIFFVWSAFTRQRGRKMARIIRFHPRNP